MHEERAKIDALEDDWSFEETIPLRPTSKEEARMIKEKWVALASAWNENIVMMLVEVLPGPPKEESSKPPPPPPPPKIRGARRGKKPIDCDYDYNCADARGMIIRVGHYVQAAMVVNGKVSVERWAYSPQHQKQKVDKSCSNFEWQRILRMGNDYLPCHVAMAGSTREGTIKVGHEHQFGRFVWRVVESGTFPDVTIPFTPGGKLPWLKNRQRLHPDYDKPPALARTIDNIEVDYEDPEELFEMDPTTKDFIPSSAASANGCLEDDFGSSSSNPDLAFHNQLEPIYQNSPSQPHWATPPQRRHSDSGTPPATYAPTQSTQSTPTKARTRKASVPLQNTSMALFSQSQPTPRIPGLPAKPPPGIALPPRKLCLPPPGLVVPPNSFPYIDYTPNSAPVLKFFNFPTESSPPSVTNPPLYGRQPPPNPYPDFCAEAEKYRYWSFRFPTRSGPSDQGLDRPKKEFELPESIRVGYYSPTFHGVYSELESKQLGRQTPPPPDLVQHTTGVPRLFLPLLRELATEDPQVFTDTEHIKLQKASFSPPSDALTAEFTEDGPDEEQLDPEDARTEDELATDDDEYETDTDDESVVFIIAPPRYTGIGKSLSTNPKPVPPRFIKPPSEPKPVHKQSHSIPIIDPVGGRPRAASLYTAPPLPRIDTATATNPNSPPPSPPLLSRKEPTFQEPAATTYPSPAPSDSGTCDDIVLSLGGLGLAEVASGWSANGQFTLPSSPHREAEGYADTSGVVTAAIQPDCPTLEELAAFAGGLSLEPTT